MSLYILDSDHVSLFQRTHPRVVRRIAATSPEDLAVTIITVEEPISAPPPPIYWCPFIGA